MARAQPVEQDFHHRRADDTDYGLAASVWTTDLSTAHRAAAGIQAGR